MSQYWVINLRAEAPAVGLAANVAQLPRMASEGPSNTWTNFTEKVNGLHLLIITHGFNVDEEEGFRSLSGTINAMDAQGRLQALNIVPVIALWPGDWLLPVVNYPAAHEPAMRAGRQLAAQFNRIGLAASAISLISHSLGARVVLEAARSLAPNHRIDTLCLTAAAVDDDVLTRPRHKPAGRYADVTDRCSQVMILHSVSDLVLAAAYPAGDLAADLIWGDGDSPFRGALGLWGPKPRKNSVIPPHRAIPWQQFHGHGDYLGGAPFSKPAKVADFLYHLMARQPQRWP